MTIDVTDATFEVEVLDRSVTTPVVVDLWAPWCGPCRTLGPIIEQVVADTDGQVVLAKINVDENPNASAAFRVQSIPAVYAVKDRKVVDGFVGAQSQGVVAEFVSRLIPNETELRIAELMAVGDEASLRSVLELDPGHEEAVVALAELLIGANQSDEALVLLERIPESPETRRVAALARTDTAAIDDIDQQLAQLLDRVKEDDEARQQYLDLLELMGPSDPRTAEYRKQLTARLF